MTAQATQERDYFSDRSVLIDPYQYFEEMRTRGPVCQLETHDALLVTGFEECVEVLRNHDDYSSINSLASAAFPLPFTPEGNDINTQLDEHREAFVGHNLIVAYDGELHSKVRSLVNRFFSPVRLKANQEFMTAYAEQLVSAAVKKRGCEMIHEISSPFVTMVIADLLGVPADDREKFREVLDSGEPAGSIDSDVGSQEAMAAMEFIGAHIYGYLEERQKNPGSDLMSELVTSTYPDGSQPDLIELTSIATFMFAAGQDTSAKLLGNAMRYIVDEPGLQAKLRADRDLIPQLIEEVLRIEGSTKATHRLAIRDTRIGERHIPAGTRVIVALAAANRDPRRWGDDADECLLGRDKIREHIAFGRGKHSCAGAPLARAEVRTILNTLFDLTSDIRISERKHGSPGARIMNWEPTFIIRGLADLHVEFDPA